MSALQNPQSESWNGINDTLYLTNFSQNDVIFKSDRVPKGMKFVIDDLGVIVTTSGGSVYIARVLNDGSTKRVTGNISSSSSGVAGVVINEGERIAVVCATTGVGVFDIYTDGTLKEKTIVRSGILEPVTFDVRANRAGF